MTAPHQALSRLGRAALEYARRGWAVFPCRPRAKTPLLERGFHDATTSPEQVAAWWQKWPEANIGCVPGPSGFVVVDVDGPEGEALAQSMGLLAEPTLEVASGREDGGRHRWYRHPGGHLGNAGLGNHLDVRADAGYVILPPSVHPSGKAYRWLGRLEEVAELPPAILARLRGAATSGASTGTPARDIPMLEQIPAGQRNATMASFAGRHLAKGGTVAEVFELAVALNEAKCRPPLPRDEVWSIVRSIAAREASKPVRVTETGTTLTVATEPEEPAEPPLAALAYEQIERAIAHGRRDFADAPRWAFRALDRLVGPMLPGELHVVGALTSNGKTLFLLSQMQSWADHGTSVLYVPLEMDPEQLRRRWAAWRVGLDYVAVERNAWADLPFGAQDRHEEALVEQAKNPNINFPPDRRVTLSRLAELTRRAVTDRGARVVVVDHFHRMDFGPTSGNYRVQVTEVARALRDMARDLGVVVVAAAQLNQDPNPLDRYFPPPLKRLKESAGISEEANVVLMLSRRLREVVDRAMLNDIRAGHKDVTELEEPGVMVVTCRKHRLDDRARDRAVFLQVQDGRVTDRLTPLLAPLNPDREWAGSTD